MSGEFKLSVYNLRRGIRIGGASIILCSLSRYGISGWAKCEMSHYGRVVSIAGIFLPMSSIV
jgi:hypothetical protein